MNRILFVALAAAAIGAPALADEIHHGPDHMHRPVMNHMAAHHHPIHCTIRHHRKVCV